MSNNKFSDIVESWKSMKLWVKIWLFYLNAIFIFCIFFWGDHEVITWILVAYLGSGPYLMSIIIPSGGLSRVLGLAHIVPWTPLCIYILLLLITPKTLHVRHLDTSTSGSFIIYLVIFSASIMISLCFDYYDVYRWLKGERYILGSKEAAAAGASQLKRVNL